MQAIAIRYLWLFGSVVAFVLFAADWSHLHGMRVGDYVMWGRDFLIFWSGGRLALEGRLDSIYDVARFHDFHQQSFGPLSVHLFAYPPTSLLFDIPFGMLPYGAAYAIWAIGGAALFAYAARPHLRAAGLPAWLAIVTPAATINLWSGQMGFVMGALWLLAFRDFDDRPRRAGLWTAAMAIKPHMALLVPLILLRRMRWATIVIAGVGVIVLVAASMLAFGVGMWRTYIDTTIALDRATIGMSGQFFQLMMTTTTAAMRQHALTIPIAGATQAITAIAAIVLLWRAAGRDTPLGALAFPAATATFLVLPYAFDYDMTVACLGMALTLRRRWDALVVWERCALGAGFLVPQACILLALAGIPLVPAILLAAFVTQLRAEGLLIPSRPRRAVPSPA